jgi:hemerythrin
MYLWDPSLAVGVAEIDEQHRELFAALGRLHVALQRRCAPGEVQPLLDFLDSYAAAHFGTEERLMERRGYPRLAAHVAQHRSFVDACARLRVDAAAGGASILHALRLGSEITTWLRRHVMQADLELAAFLRAPSAAPRPATAAAPS